MSVKKIAAINLTPGELFKLLAPCGRGGKRLILKVLYLRGLS